MSQGPIFETPKVAVRDRFFNWSSERVPAARAKRGGQGRRSITWLPVHDRGAVEEFGVQGKPVRFLIGLAALFSMFALKPVARATGVSLANVAPLWGIFASWYLIAYRLLYRPALVRKAPFYALVFGNVAVGSAFALALPILGRRPDTPLWIGFSIMACVNGASETQGSLIFGSYFFVAPFLTLPFFHAMGCPTGRAAAWALVCGAASGYGYWFLARRREHWRQDRHDSEMRLAQERLAASERERDRLSRDLHDSVGTALSMVGLYASLAEHRAADPLEARRLAGTIRSSVREALNELRGVLQALPQRPARLADLVASLAAVARRAAEPTGSNLIVVVQEGGDLLLDGETRIGVVRIFHEAVHNALHHGQPLTIRASFSAADGHLTMVVNDDGEGFDPARVTAGTGIAGMRERAQELRGTLSVDSSRGAGTRLSLRLPLDSAGRTG
jgi:signal transduction histidine kinase